VYCVVIVILGMFFVCWMMRCRLLWDGCALWMGLFMFVWFMVMVCRVLCSVLLSVWGWGICVSSDHW